MIAQQGKIELTVIELGAIGIQPIVADQATCAKGLHVSLHICSIQVAVTVLASTRLKVREDIAMAVVTGKGSTRGSMLVPCQ